MTMTARQHAEEADRLLSSVQAIAERQARRDDIDRLGLAATGQLQAENAQAMFAVTLAHAHAATATALYWTEPRFAEVTEARDGADG